MNKVKKDKLRSSVLHENEILHVRYTGDAVNFPKDTVIDAIPKFIKKSGLPYPSPKYVACCYAVVDLDGEYFEVAKERYGKLHEGFVWI